MVCLSSEKYLLGVVSMRAYKNKIIFWTQIYWREISVLKKKVDHEHSLSGNPNSIFICGTGKSLGKSIGIISLNRIYDKYKKEYFPKLLESPNVPPEDK
jgi:hypothetical protein